jgi:hypothetical protein
MQWRGISMPASRSGKPTPFGSIAAGFIAIVLLAPMAVAQDAFTVQLLTPLSATSNHKGDAVRATVVSPASFQANRFSSSIS